MYVNYVGPEPTFNSTGNLRLMKPTKQIFLNDSGILVPPLIDQPVATISTSGFDLVVVSEISVPGDFNEISFGYSLYGSPIINLIAFTKTGDKISIRGDFENYYISYSTTLNKVIVKFMFKFPGGVTVDLFTRISATGTSIIDTISIFEFSEFKYATVFFMERKIPFVRFRNRC